MHFAQISFAWRILRTDGAVVLQLHSVAVGVIEPPSRRFPARIPPIGDVAAPEVPNAAPGLLVEEELLRLFAVADEGFDVLVEDEVAAEPFPRPRGS